MSRVVLKNTGFVFCLFCIFSFLDTISIGCLGRGELGDSLGALRDGMLGELSGEDKADSGLDLPRGDGGLLGDTSKLGGLSGDLVKHVVHEGVEDGHGLGRNASVGVDLLEDLVEIDLH